MTRGFTFVWCCSYLHFALLRSSQNAHWILNNGTDTEYAPKPSVFNSGRSFSAFSNVHEIWQLDSSYPDIMVNYYTYSFLHSVCIYSLSFLRETLARMSLLILHTQTWNALYQHISLTDACLTLTHGCKVIFDCHLCYWKKKISSNTISRTCSVYPTGESRAKWIIAQREERMMVPRRWASSLWGLWCN